MQIHDTVLTELVREPFRLCQPCPGSRRTWPPRVLYSRQSHHVNHLPSCSCSWWSPYSGDRLTVGKRILMIQAHPLILIQDITHMETVERGTRGARVAVVIVKDSVVTEGSTILLLWGRVVQDVLLRTGSARCRNGR